ncbi:RNA polymerase sigma factor [Paenibacillus psychroresistens]|uniref:RNA polymerase sigma factor n=1 Tax=Paenibacillus psychroresistens TaxID=1778678 RepID=A0A6B8RG50_9BACL|nr:RNA polymerase sigma factor [Paenibacillus psychroresistens]QGQ94704.1 RNA polymerase sigma factor [Paenibacillus psychroresistens]
MGDNEAFNSLYQNYYNQVYYSAYAVIKDHFLAQDIVQETFMKVFRHLHALKEEGKRGAWLNVISRNTAIDFYRKRLGCLEISDDNIEINSVAVDVGMDTYIELKVTRELLSSLEPQHWQSLLLIYEYGLTYEQLASYQKTSVSAIKSKLYRAKKKLRLLAREMEESC